MIKFITAGESHGKAVVAIAEGFPSNLKISADYINTQLKRRQAGYGRGQRMKIEKDTVEIISGIRYGKTLGSPITLMVRNNDWENWKEIMDSEVNPDKPAPVTIPRPGHADLTGTLKYDYDDIRNSIERSSARETTARVAAGSIARKFLEEFGITVGSFVESIGGIYPTENPADQLLANDLSFIKDAAELNELADRSDVRVIDEAHERKIINKIKTAKKKGDTLGGSFYIIVTGVPGGLGSFVHYERKINAALAGAIMSINGVKGVEIGGGSRLGEAFGSSVHDEIIFDGTEITRKTNRAGGIEGGITTGLPLIIKGVMKPISTLMTPLKSIDLKGLKTVESRRERSDFVAVPACAVIAESMTAWVVADFFMQKFGGDSVKEIKQNYSGYKKRILQQIRRNF
jgi:chorismate synthase